MYITTTNQNELVEPSDVLTKKANASEALVETSTQAQTTQKPTEKPTVLSTSSSFQTQPPPVEPIKPSNPPMSTQLPPLSPPSIPIDQFPLTNDALPNVPPPPSNGTKLKTRLKLNRKQKKKPLFRKPYDLENQFMFNPQE